MTIEDDNFLVNKQSNENMKTSSCSSVSSDGMMGNKRKWWIGDIVIQEKELMRSGR